MTTNNPLDCPKCGIGRLARVSLQLNVRTPDGKPRLELLDLDQCGACNGVWFDHGELEKYLGARLTVLDSETVGMELRDRMDREPGMCPRCEDVMKLGPAPKDESVTADYCPRCGGVWLDSGELDRLEKANRGSLDRLSRWLEKTLPDSWWDRWSSRGR